jgi:hypothetical protein
VRQSIHALLHLVPEAIRVGPLGLVAQWAMERTIGNLGQEIKQLSSPYANLAQRGLFRAQVNALKAMIPDLEPETSSIPRGGVDLGSGYHLLRAKDATAHEVRECEASVIIQYLRDAGHQVSEDWQPTVVRWARLRLPNGQISRSAWKERSMAKIRRARDVKVISLLWSSSS